MTPRLRFSLHPSGNHPERRLKSVRIWACVTAGGLDCIARAADSLIALEFASSELYAVGSGYILCCSVPLLQGPLVTQPVVPLEFPTRQDQGIRPSQPDTIGARSANQPSSDSSQFPLAAFRSIEVVTMFDSSSWPPRATGMT